MKSDKIIYPELSYVITGLCFEIHNTLGRYSRETQYSNALEEILKSKNIKYIRELSIQNTGNILDFLIEDKIILNKLGVITKHCWRDLPNHYKNCILDSFIIMPNHFHGIIQITNAIRDASVETIHESSLRESPYEHKIKRRKMLLSKIIGRFKMQSSKKINLVNRATYFNWQKSYYDHIIRNEEDLFRVREYIKNNPKNYNK